MIYGDKVLFPIESVVINYIDLLHSTNFPELIPLWTTAAHLEKHPILIIKLAVNQKPVSSGCAVPGSPSESPAPFHHWFVQFHTPPTAGLPFCWIKGNLAKPLLPGQELTDGEWVLITRAVIFQTFSIKWEWKQAMSFLMVLRGYSISSCFSSSGCSCTQWQILGQHQFTESPVNIHNYLLCNLWPQHCIRSSPIPQVIQLVL